MSKKSVLSSESISRKWQLASDLFDMAFKTKQYQIKKKFPELSDLEINKKAYELIEKGCR